ncbi:S-methyl-5-thioribose-1-phosphate isomerase [Paramaledivibacter caminithermalis]|jgi:methylthioribose-1-phosphate isomerase|uniref:Methylthioribose-1-phosphate isomerase n=1 Tax=Paramaledivibacter caminithermalis (strain DSM 15212 / CIP 107654 / DViRD3) TaxID=1121301 RepID=A0A1M6P526_PARC5|nr:S-methyl-5-thioribose-1-phosphate isomerase [Paramaledivibacter caminithermalis]SHK03031.1 methylthioribose-1-phosphate isomerase [Paramaledivibacter caminithermalis DSM 15212]
MITTVVPARLNEDKTKLVLIDQTQLPTKEVFLELDDRERIFEAIKMLRVRGAPAIGIAAAFGLYVCANKIETENYAEFRKEFEVIRDYLATSRPTAVNLFWALDRMTARFDKEVGKSVSEIKVALLEESEAILAEDQAMGKAIGEYGLELLKPNMGLLTHCNAGGIATSGIGTALAPIYLGHEKGYNFKVFADETRPLLQGSRLTAYELNKAGIDVTVICDNMASQVMKEGKIDAVLVGCDRIAANGDTANKIGTCGVAILAKEYGIPMYILGPTSTIDMSTPTGKDIEIELRDEDEIGNGFGRRTAPEGVKAYNPAFDVTEARYITAIITEKGIVYPPFGENLEKLFK